MKRRTLWLILALLLLLSSCTTATVPKTVDLAEPEVESGSPAWLKEALFLHFGRMGEDDPCYAAQYEKREYEKMQSFTLCESTADYVVFRKLCEEIWPGGD